MSTFQLLLLLLDLEPYLLPVLHWMLQQQQLAA
jgi:hypothetical protein